MRSPASVLVTWLAAAATVESVYQTCGGAAVKPKGFAERSER